jgi:hypothetical protein
VYAELEALGQAKAAVDAALADLTSAHVQLTAEHQDQSAALESVRAELALANE